MSPLPPYVPAASFPVPATWQFRRSPHYEPRTQRVSAIVLHADASERVESTLAWLQDPIQKGSKTPVSYHVLISRVGAVFYLVHPDAKAYHAGASTFRGRPWCNGYSVGVSMSNKNDGAEPFPPAQRDAALAVCVALCRHYGLTADDITTHAEVATPAGRKNDPLGFDLAAFRSTVAGALSSVSR